MVGVMDFYWRYISSHRRLFLVRFNGDVSHGRLMAKGFEKAHKFSLFADSSPHIFIDSY